MSETKMRTNGLRRNAILLCATLAIALATAATAAHAAGYKPRTERGALTYNIVRKWAGMVQARHKRDARQWAQEMLPRFRKAPIAHLRNAAMATSFEAMNDALLGMPVAASAPASAAGGKLLGQFERDFIFTPVPPCRIADTRVAGGPLAGGETRQFKGYADSFADQGGSATTCGIPISPAVLVLNVTAVDPVAPGFMTVFITGQPRPLASSLNYAAGQIINNQVMATMVSISPVAQNSTFSLYSFAGAHVVIDVVGYFDDPLARFEPLDCTSSVATRTIPAGSANTPVFVGCGQGNLTSVSCNTTFDPELIVLGWDTNSGGVCRIGNPSAVDRVATVSARCCRYTAY